MARLPRLMGRGRALEVLMGADDVNGDLAERYGYVNRSLPDAELDRFVEALATRIASFDKQAITDTKRLVNRASLPSDSDLAAEWEAFIASIQRPARSGSDPEAHGTRVPRAGRCRISPGIPRRPTWPGRRHDGTRAAHRLRTSALRRRVDDMPCLIQLWSLASEFPVRCIQRRKCMQCNHLHPNDKTVQNDDTFKSAASAVSPRARNVRRCDFTVYRRPLSASVLHRGSLRR
jgi:hypothetical protein